MYVKLSETSAIPGYSSMRSFVPDVATLRWILRTFAQKSSHIEICFISCLKLGHKLLIPKMEKNWGLPTLFWRKRQGKNALISIDRSSQGGVASSTFYSCAVSAWGIKCPLFLVFCVTLVHGNLCLHTFRHLTVTLRGAGGRGLFKTINSCWKMYCWVRKINSLLIFLTQQ